jgi:hypothetical protein
MYSGKIAVPPGGGGLSIFKYPGIPERSNILKFTSHQRISTLEEFLTIQSLFY